MRDERDAAIAHCAQSTRTSRHLTQAHVDFAVESARAAKARVEDSWGAQTAQLLQVVKDSTAIMGEQVRVAAATPRPLARVLLAEAAASGLLEGIYNSGAGNTGAGTGTGTGRAVDTPGRPSSRGHTSGSSRQHSPPGGGGGATLQDLPVSQTLGDTLRQTGGWIERGVGAGSSNSSRGGTPSSAPSAAPATSAAAAAAAAAAAFSLKRPDPSALHSTLPLGGDTAAMYKSYSAALRRAESAGATEIERVAAEGDRLLSTHDAAAGAALREAGRVNALAGAEIADLRTTVASLSARLQDSQRGEKLAAAAALAAPLGVVLGATTPVLLQQQQQQDAFSSSRAPSPLTHRRAGTSPKRPPPSPSLPPSSSSPHLSSSSSARVGGGVLGMNSQHDPIAGAPSPWPAAHNSASLLASPVRWRPSKAGAFPQNPHSSASASSPLGIASPGGRIGAAAAVVASGLSSVSSSPPSSSSSAAAGAGKGVVEVGGGGGRVSAFLSPGKQGGAGGSLPHPTLTDMLANINSGKTESLGLPVAVAVARQQRQMAAAAAAAAYAPPPALPPTTGAGVSAAGSLEGGSLAELDL